MNGNVLARLTALDVMKTQDFKQHWRKLFGSEPPVTTNLRAVPAAALKSVRETLKESGDPGAADPLPDGPSFLQARTANEVLKAQERKLRLQRLKGELIDQARATRRRCSRWRDRSATPGCSAHPGSQRISGGGQRRTWPCRP